MTRPEVRRSVVIVQGRHRPHEQLLLAYSAALGIALLAGAPPPMSMTPLPDLLVTVWAGGLAVSGVAGLTGCWLRGERGLGVELGGLLLNAGALLIYSVAVFSAGGVRALLPGGVVLAWSAANLWRARQALRDIREIRGTT